jgi:hypothetical protein
MESRYNNLPLRATTYFYENLNSRISLINRKSFVLYVKSSKSVTSAVDAMMLSGIARL